MANPRLGSAAEGAQAFGRCGACHSLQPGVNGRGPTLHGLFGRKAGSVPGFRYSPAFSHATIIWDDDSLSEFLSGPKEFFRGRKIAPHPRVADPRELGDLLAYLEGATR